MKTFILPLSVPVYVFGVNVLSFARRAERSSSPSSPDFETEGNDDGTAGKGESASSRVWGSWHSYFCSRRPASVSCERIAAISSESSFSSVLADGLEGSISLDSACSSSFVGRG